MADTIQQECKKCEQDTDCIEGICLACSEGVYFCACGEEISEEQLDNVGVCKDCM